MVIPYGHTIWSYHMVYDFLQVYRSLFYSTIWLYFMAASPNFWPPRPPWVAMPHRASSAALCSWPKTSAAPPPSLSPHKADQADGSLKRMPLMAGLQFLKYNVYNTDEFWVMNLCGDFWCLMNPCEIRDFCIMEAWTSLRKLGTVWIPVTQHLSWLLHAFKKLHCVLALSTSISTPSRERYLQPLHQGGRC